MQQSEVVESVGKHLDALSDTIKWALLLALVFWWAGFTGTDSVEVLGMKVPRAHALWVSVFVYVIVNATVLVLFLRLGDLLKLADEAHLGAALGKLALHPWPLNPFAHFGERFIARLHSGIGFGSLIVVWWVCNSSLYVFAEQVHSPTALLLQGTFLVVGLASMQAINRVYGVVVHRTTKFDPTLHNALLSTRAERLFLAFVSIGIGWLIALVTRSFAPSL